MTDQPDRRFTSTTRLLGPEAFKRLQKAHVVVVGIGGVGSWAAEALARSGVGNLTLVDLDQIVESNINRQVHALESTLGAAKVDVMARRIQQIAPLAGIRAIEAFVEPGNIDEVMPRKADIVIDAIDAVVAKAALVSWCVNRQWPVIVCGAAGGRRDPGKPGKLRLLYEASPMAMLVEQAGGAATDGRQRILDIPPQKLHQRVPVFLGSKEEVERVTAYHG